MSQNNAQAVSAEDEAAVRNVPQRIVTAWAGNDADAFAAVFTEDGSMILPGTHLSGREAIGSYMKAAFAGPYAGTRVFGTPVAVKPLSASLVLLISKGGVLAPGETEVAPERAVNASWLVTKQGSEWLLTAYQNTPAEAA